jgi:hypothetical protein
VSDSNLPSLGILCRGDRAAPDPRPQFLLDPVFELLARYPLNVIPVPYDDEAVNEVREQLLQLDGVVVWVDPIEGGRNRSLLDPLLRDVAARGIWVSTHPDVILKMGTKDVLVKTREMEWGADTYLYASLDEMRTHLPRRLSEGPRVLKQHRGNGGNGVWKVEHAGPGAAQPESPVQVLHARRGGALETMPLADFYDRCATYFSGNGCMIDQPYLQRAGEGMVRCYMVRDRVVGFGHQYVTALLPLRDGETESPAPPPRLYYGPDKAEFQVLKRKLESGWLAEMQRVLDVDTASLPLLWDADFLLGPAGTDGNDTYVLCETNVSSVWPVPDEALSAFADAVVQQLQRSA